MPKFINLSTKICVFHYLYLSLKKKKKKRNLSITQLENLEPVQYHTQVA